MRDGLRRAPPCGGDSEVARGELARSRGLGAIVGAALAVAAGAGPASAQVLEIQHDGAVVVYDRPAVFTAEGVSVIEAPPTPATRAGRPGAPTGVAAELDRAARLHQLSPELVSAVARRESGFRIDAVSSKGAVGVMQLTAQAASDVGVDRFDPVQNIGGGVAYLRRMIDAFGGDLRLGLAAYNAGPGAVRRYAGVPPYPETRAYVAAILADLGVADRSR